jgi:hypothetical protein
MATSQIINLTNNMPLKAAGGPVTVVVHTGQPNSYQFDLALRFKDHSIRNIAVPAKAGTVYPLDTPANLEKHAACVCWGAIFTPGAGSLFELHCEFFQDGVSVGVSQSVTGSTTGSTVTFSLACIFT